MGPRSRNAENSVRVSRVLHRVHEDVCERLVLFGDLMRAFDCGNQITPYKEQGCCLRAVTGDLLPPCRSHEVSKKTCEDYRVVKTGYSDISPVRSLASSRV